MKCSQRTCYGTIFSGWRGQHEQWEVWGKSPLQLKPSAPVQHDCPLGHRVWTTPFLTMVHPQLPEQRYWFWWCALGRFRDYWAGDLWVAGRKVTSFWWFIALTERTNVCWTGGSSELPQELQCAGLAGYWVTLDFRRFVVFKTIYFQHGKTKTSKPLSEHQCFKASSKLNNVKKFVTWVHSICHNLSLRESGPSFLCPEDFSVLLPDNGNTVPAAGTYLKVLWFGQRQPWQQKPHKIFTYFYIGF